MDFKTHQLNKLVGPDLAVSAAARLYPGAADAVDLVHEDDAGRVLLRHHEQLPHHPTALADELLDELGAGHSAETFGLFSTRGADTTLPDEGALGVMGHSSGKQSLPRSRGPPFWGGSCAACSCRS